MSVAPPADPPEAQDQPPRHDESQDDLDRVTCGTYSPGQTDEPCQHSLNFVLCCACAGCMNGEWDCGRVLDPESWLYFQFDRYARIVGDILTHPFAYGIYFVILVALWVTGWIQLMWTFLLMSAALSFFLVTVVIGRWIN